MNVFGRAIYTTVAFHIFILILIYKAQRVKSCLATQKVGHQQHPPIPKREEPWNNGQAYQRKDYSKNCDCGLNYKVPTWKARIEVNDKDKRLIRTCTGTIINTKMVITSNSCLNLNDNGRLPPYQTWDPPPKNAGSVLAAPDNIVVHLRDYSTDPPTDFPKTASKIIYNEKWKMSPVTKAQPPDNDIAIIILSWVIPLEIFSPLCIPERNDHFDPTGYKGFYYGYGGDLLDDPTPETRDVGNLVVLPGLLCDKDNGLTEHSGNDTLCTQYRMPPPTATGGPLLMAPNGMVATDGFTDDQRVLLIGISSVGNIQSKVDPKSSKVTTYFTNIQPWISYLEYHAEKVNAKWCTGTPAIKLNGEARVMPLENGLRRKYKWEGTTPIKRDESLDCVCGLHNLERQANARITGGEDATPREFPWMVLIFIYWYDFVGEFDGGASSGLCGGSIINDRMILTAAHCVLRPSRLLKHGAEEAIPDAISIFLSNHDFFGDPKAHAIHMDKNFTIHYSHDFADVYGRRGECNGDFALIELGSPITNFSTAKKHGQAKPGDIRPICLPNPDKPIRLTDRVVTLAGWGITGDIGDEANWNVALTLQKIKFSVHSMAECSKRSSNVFSDSFICTGTFDKNRASTTGDSGGPLAIRTEDGWWTQVALVSYGDTDETAPVDANGEHPVSLQLDTNLQKYLRFLDYHSRKAGAKWCKSHV